MNERKMYCIFAQSFFGREDITLCRVAKENQLDVPAVALGKLLLVLKHALELRMRHGSIQHRMAVERTQNCGQARPEFAVKNENLFFCQR